MKTGVLEKILKGNISLIGTVDVKEAALCGVDVIVYPSNVKSMIEEYLNENITSAQITEWASFLCLRPEYDCPLEYRDKDEDYYEEMWHVVQKLSTPEIDGKINIERAVSYLQELNKYFI